jgi:hypothetical protein
VCARRSPRETSQRRPRPGRCEPGEIRGRSRGRRPAAMKRRYRFRSR